MKDAGRQQPGFAIRAIRSQRVRSFWLRYKRLIGYDSWTPRRVWLLQQVDFWHWNFAEVRNDICGFWWVRPGGWAFSGRLLYRSHLVLWLWKSTGIDLAHSSISTHKAVLKPASSNPMSKPPAPVKSDRTVRRFLFN